MENYSDLKQLRREYTGMAMQALLNNANLYDTAIKLQSPANKPGDIVYDHIRKSQDELYHKLSKEAFHIATIMTLEVQDGENDLVNRFNGHAKKFTGQYP